jgi:hypothetical protein
VWLLNLKYISWPSKGTQSSECLFFVCWHNSVIILIRWTAIEPAKSSRNEPLSLGGILNKVVELRISEIHLVSARDVNLPDGISRLPCVTTY